MLRSLKDRTGRGFWPRFALAAAALLMPFAAGGCALFSQQQEPPPPRTVQEFVKQPRPGNGVLGP
jgi:hypothetical protein